MIFGCCFQTTIVISATLLSASFIDAFQPYYYYYQQQLHRTENILGFTEEKLDKIETRKDEKGTILTLEIGVLDEHVNWLKVVST